jgi:hypothetical protein
LYFKALGVARPFVPAVNTRYPMRPAHVRMDRAASTDFQNLAIAWANKLAKEQNKFLRISEIHGRYLHLLENWSEMFDETAFPFLMRERKYDAQQCVSKATFEESYLGMLEPRAEGLVLPLPTPTLCDKVAAAPTIRVSVHGRSLEGTCVQLPQVCGKDADETKLLREHAYVFAVCQTPWLPYPENAKEECTSVGSAAFAALKGNAAVKCAADLSVENSQKSLDQQGTEKVPVFDAADTGPTM